MLAAVVCPNPVFIVGTERSGSNLLRLMLDAHSQIAIPHPPHILAYFAKLETLYARASPHDAFPKLVDDVLRHVAGHIHPWPVLPDRQELLSIPSRDVIGLFLNIYDQYLRATGKPCWGCKSTFVIHHVEALLARRPASRFIWLVRDPRDVAGSSKSSVFNPFHPYFTARLWSHQQQIGISLQSRLHEERWLRVHYEDLVAAPEATLARICRFLRIDYEPEMLRYFESEEAHALARSATDWRNTAHPVLRQNAGTYKRTLSRREIAAVEVAAGPLMERLGYRPDSSERPHVASSLIRYMEYAARNGLLRLRVEYRSLREDRFHWRRWKRAARMALLTARLRFGMR
jgi:hypothetical protein